MNDTRSAPAVFISTAIPYVNAPPHLGFALEVVLADAIARHARLRGATVCFSSGTDDNSLKNVRAAELAGVPTAQFVESTALHYRALESVLGATFDVFIRTSTDPRHAAAVNAIWNACADRGNLEKRPYQGLYCVGCEQFYEPVELVDGLCPEHGTPLELVEEENWFFRLSHYQEVVLNALRSHVLRITPQERANEVLRFVESGLRDVSVSRSQSRARGWGIPVPNDPGQVIYVWFDALANYLAALDHPNDAHRVAAFWQHSTRRAHVVGKGISRFHAVLWPAILIAAGLPLPTDLLVHGYITVDGKKIGKSLGNAIAPDVLIARFGLDALRYYLLRHVGAVNDGDVDQVRLKTVHDTELADGLGNLVARVLALLKKVGPKTGEERAPTSVSEIGRALLEQSTALAGDVDAALEHFATDEALRKIWVIVAAANEYVGDTAPWTIAKARTLATTSVEREALNNALCDLLFPVVSALRAIADELRPFLPTTAKAIAAALDDPLSPAPILFPKERSDGTAARPSST